MKLNYVALLAFAYSTVSLAAPTNASLAKVQNGDYLAASGDTKQTVGLIKVRADLSRNSLVLAFPAPGDATDSYSYLQTYSCPVANEPCQVVDDKLGYAKYLKILSDGSLSYENASGESRSFVPRSPFDKLGAPKCISVSHHPTGWFCQTR